MDRIFQGFQALVASSFPKTCRCCGKVYPDVASFFEETRSLGRGSDIRPSETDDGEPELMLFRNCSCGSTLMEDFAERRDTSEQGRLRRALFAELKGVLVRRGFAEAEAHDELLKVIHGEPSEKLSALGISLVPMAMPG